MVRKDFVSVIIAAAGVGKRMNSSISKQYLCLMGKPILVHTIEAFEGAAMVDEIIIVVHPDELEYCKKEVVEPYYFKKISRVIIGGAERQESVYNGLKAVDERCTIAMVHDGARPLVTEELILKSIEHVKKHKAVGVGTPVKDTIKIVDEENVMIQTPDRKRLWAIQTPQTFEYSLLLKAHEEAAAKGFLGTDDTVLVENLGISVKMILGSYENIKVTTPEDIFIGEAIMQYRKSI